LGRRFLNNTSGLLSSGIFDENGKGKRAKKNGVQVMLAGFAHFILWAGVDSAWEQENSKPEKCSP
jgi:hypothetical protein